MRDSKSDNEADLTLKKAIDICRAAEVSREQVKSLTDSKSAEIDALHKTKQDSRRSNLREDFRDKQNREHNHTRKFRPIVVNNVQPNHAQRTGSRVTIAINLDTLPNSGDRLTDNVKGNPFAI